MFVTTHKKRLDRRNTIPSFNTVPHRVSEIRKFKNYFFVVLRIKNSHLTVVFADGAEVRPAVEDGGDFAEHASIYILLTKEFFLGVEAVKRFIYVD